LDTVATFSDLYLVVLGVYVGGGGRRRRRKFREELIVTFPSLHIKYYKVDYLTVRHEGM
jgi:hypothetical protein